MRSDRLLAMLLLLQSHGTLSATQIASRLEVSARTVYRDMESLSSAGVPVYAERGRNGGISILPDFRTDVTGLTADESEALFILVGEAAHDDLGRGEALRSGLRKLMAALPAAHRDQAARASERILIDPTPWGMVTPAGDGLPHVQEAVFAGRILTFRYQGRNVDESTIVHRAVPIGLVGRGGSWYLVSTVDARHRVFRIDRMSAIELLEQVPPTLTQPSLFEVWQELDAQYRRDYAAVTARVRVRRSILGVFLRVHARDLAEAIDPAEHYGQEWSYVHLSFRSFGHAQSLLAFGADLDVLEPAALIDHLNVIVDELSARRHNAGSADPSS